MFADFDKAEAAATGLNFTPDIVGVEAYVLGEAPPPRARAFPISPTEGLWPDDFLHAALTFDPTTTKGH